MDERVFTMDGTEVEDYAATYSQEQLEASEEPLAEYTEEAALVISENQEGYNENQEESLFKYKKQDEYVSSKNIEDKKESVIKSDNNIQHKKNSNGELDLDFLDIPYSRAIDFSRMSVD